MNSDTKDMSFTDLVAKLNEIETRDTVRRRARHQSQLDSSKKKQSPVASELTKALNESKIDENVLGATQVASSIIPINSFNNKEQKAQEISEGETADEQAVHKAFTQALATLNRLEKMFAMGGILEKKIQDIGGESDAKAIQEALANAYDYLEDGHFAAMGHIHSDTPAHQA